MGEEKKRSLNWPAIRADWEQGCTINDIVNRHAVPRGTLRARAARESWIRMPSQPMTPPSPEVVAAVHESHRAMWESVRDRTMALLAAASSPFEVQACAATLARCEAGLHRAAGIRPLAPEPWQEAKERAVPCVVEVPRRGVADEFFGAALGEVDRGEVDGGELGGAPDGRLDGDGADDDA